MMWGMLFQKIHQELSLEPVSVAPLLVKFRHQHPSVSAHDLAKPCVEGKIGWYRSCVLLGYQPRSTSRGWSFIAGYGCGSKPISKWQTLDCIKSLHWNHVPASPRPLTKDKFTQQNKTACFTSMVVGNHSNVEFWPQQRTKVQTLGKRSACVRCNGVDAKNVLSKD